MRSNRSPVTPRYTNRRSFLTRRLRACFVCRWMRAYVCCVARPMAWTGMWVMSIFLSITFKDGDGRPLGFVCWVIGKERVSCLSFSSATSLAQPRHVLISLRSSLRTSGPAILFQLPARSRRGVWSVERFNETSNRIEYFSSYRLSITSRFDKRMRQVFAWINLCSDRSCVILPLLYFHKMAPLIRGLSLCVNYVALIGSLNDRGLKRRRVTILNRHNTTRIKYFSTLVIWYGKY